MDVLLVVDRPLREEETGAPAHRAEAAPPGVVRADGPQLAGGVPHGVHQPRSGAAERTGEGAGPVIGRNVRWPALPRRPGPSPTGNCRSAHACPRRDASPTMSTPIMDLHRTPASSTRSRRGWGFLTAAGSAGLVLAACSGASPTTPPPAPLQSRAHDHYRCAGRCGHVPPHGHTGARGWSSPPTPGAGREVGLPGGRPRAGWTRPTSSSRSPSKAPSLATPPSSSARTPRSSVPSVRPVTSTSGYSASWARPWRPREGINPVLANIEASPLINVDLMDYGSLQTHPSGRVAPYDTYSTTAQLWSTHPTLTTPPQPLFTYSKKTPKGTPVSSVTIDFSGTSDVTWRYDPTSTDFLRFYNGATPDLLADGVQNSAANVIVQYVQISYGPWLENSEGGLEVQADLYPNASGVADVFRGGTEITGTWSRSSLGSPTRFLTAGGAQIPLQPGQTWVELVPNTITATTIP